MIAALLLAAAPIPAQQFVDWEFTHDETQCAARKTTPKGTFLIYTWEPGAEAIVVVAVNPAWTGKVRKGATHAVSFTFDANRPFADAAGWSIQIPGYGIGYAAQTGEVERLLGELGTSDVMELRADGAVIERVDLQGSDEVVRSLRACAASL